MKQILSLAFAASLLAAGAQAHEGHAHGDKPAAAPAAAPAPAAPAPAASGGHAHASPNGGRIVDVAPYHLELVATGGDVTLHVYDADMKPVDAAGAKAEATVLAGKTPSKVALAPAGGNALKGSGSFTAGPDTKVVVSLAMPGGKPVQARYDLGK
ncbi:MAG TPA: hypothetical protein VEB20_19280 [Azospirillaceae bacterium]|nr:hypothetical protein [Azospirillaceae bacterium]